MSKPAIGAPETAVTAVTELGGEGRLRTAALDLAGLRCETGHPSGATPPNTS